MSKVTFVKVKHEPNGVQDAVKKAMELAEWRQYIKGDRVFIKINGISSQLIPGICTSPWIIDGVMSVLKKELPDTKFYIGDANLAATRQLEKAATVWGFFDLAKKYDMEFINLSQQPTEKREINGRHLKEMAWPKILLDVDCIVNLPLAKTHALTDITCCLKNHWGLMPRFRHQLHPYLHDVIADINMFFKKTVFNVVDATICSEGNAPRTGIPKICDLIFAGHDRVSVDSAVATFMGLDPKQIKHIIYSEGNGVGESKFEIVGDEFYVDKFIKANPKKQAIFFWEMLLRRIPLLKPILFDTPVFKILAWIATQYNQFYWYNLHGKKYAENTIFNTWYKDEFIDLWNRSKGKKSIQDGDTTLKQPPAP